MSNQIVISSGAKVRSLEGVLTGSAGIVSSVPLGGANGVATLDSGGKVPVSQLPSSVVTYLGTWDAATNTPTLTNGTGDAGDMYICNVAGTVDFGAGPITFAVGDWVLYGSGTWQKSNGQNGTVTSVAVTESGNALSISGSPISTAGVINIGFAGNSTQYINGEGNLVTFPTLITEAQNLITDVYNETGATLTKGTVVYINGGHGNLPTVTKALATSDATSAQTYGVVQADITNNNNGHVVVIGSLGDLDTQAYPAGTQLYLSSTTAGAWTSVKQYAPAHLVYVGIVVRSHPTQGIVEIKIQNGFELDELHNVSAQTPSNNDGLFYNSSNSLWENKSIATALGYTPANGANYVPYTGATQSVNLGNFGLSASALTVATNFILNSTFLLKKAGLGTTTPTHVSQFAALTGVGIGYSDGTGGGNFVFPTAAIYDYTFPATTGTVALTSDIPSLANYVTTNTTQTISGSKTFSTNIIASNGIVIGANPTETGSYSTGNIGIGGQVNGSTTNLLFTTGASYAARFYFTNTANYSYTFPASTGTIALTSDLSSYLPLTGGTLTGALSGTSATFASTIQAVGTLFLQRASSGASTTLQFKNEAGNNRAKILFGGTNEELGFYAGDGSAANLTIASAGAATFSNSVVIGNSSTTGKQLVVNQTGTTGYFLSGEASGTEIAYWYYNSSEIQFSSKASTRALTFLTNDTERMRITSGGNVLIGKSSVDWTLIGLQTEDVGRLGITHNISSSNLFLRKNNVTGTAAEFWYNSSSVGSITISTTNTAFNTSSDYRLKEDLQQIKGLEKISKIKVYDFKWKDTTDRMDGVLAHELQEVIPFAVNGEKDAVNEDGTIKPQAVDYSKLVPVLVKAIQEQTQIIKDLEARIVSLESK